MTPTRFIRTSLAALLSVALVPALAGAQNREQLQLMADLRMIQEQVARLQLAVSQIGQQAAALDKRLEADREAAVKAAADEQLRLNALTQGVTIIREKLDDNTTRAAQQAQELTALIASIRIINDQLSTLTNLLRPPVNPVDPDAPDTEPVSSPGGAALPPSPTSLFNQAMSDYFSNNLQLAIEGFEEFVEKFPTAPDAPKAQYYIGQSYFDQRRFKEAIAAYGKVITNYKDADEVPQAYFAQGRCYEELRQPGAARAAFQAIIKLFPNSTEALMAQQRLKAPGNQ
jgi:tol-pal system protein YbgF